AAARPMPLVPPVISAVVIYRILSCVGAAQVAAQAARRASRRSGFFWIWRNSIKQPLQRPSRASFRDPGAKSNAVGGKRSGRSNGLVDRSGFRTEPIGTLWTGVIPWFALVFG